ncbi:MAG: PD-(D/E)XK nuclease family protein [Rubrivivax sp.]|nr:PD-(D/E)XK nuclease family protein [Rubrivivax sp.]
MTSSPLTSIPPETDLDGELLSQEESLLALIEALRRVERDFRLATGFNVFEAAAMARQEIRHSRFLAFLLDPGNPHGLGSAFLRAILSAAVAEHPDPPVSRLDVAVADLGSCSVHCERDHFDIAVEVPSRRLLFVIENKIEAAESTEQLQKYRARALSRYQDYRFMGTFLTPTGYEGEDDSWGTMGYATVVSELKNALQNASAPPDVAMAIAHYVQLVERKIMASQALIDACKSIYQQHRAAVDLVVQYGQEPQLALAFEQFVRTNDKPLQPTAVRSNTAWFLFDEWLRIDDFPQADRKRWSSTFPVLLWFDVGTKRLHLRLEVGPLADAEKRPRLVQAMQTRIETDKTRKGGKGKGGTYTRIVTYVTAIPEDPSVGDLVSAMEKLWKDSAHLDLKKVVGQVIGDLLTPQ